MIKLKKIHCLFEQSGTFKNEFKKLGFESFDYDIKNKFGKTDFIVNLFEEIDNAYKNKKSIFDSISKEDLIIAFFPCTYFSIQNYLIFGMKSPQFKTWSESKKETYKVEREQQRDYFYNILLKFIKVVKKRNIKTIIENPYNGNWLLNKQEIKKPTLVINDRSKFGDYYRKPTMFYFYNFEPSYFSKYIIQNNNKKDKPVNHQPKGITRSLIHSDFALNFINQYILGE